ncbi:hypothetical protein EBS67_14425 [bacterium]|jgi:hypothetical protein|nr:hypothetical protein [bacterium]NBT62948.1 hypothetical protein [Planctomycetia bacterium]
MTDKKELRTKTLNVRFTEGEIHFLKCSIYDDMMMLNKTKSFSDAIRKIIFKDAQVVSKN